MLKIGIVGLPNVGKSTLFKALTRKQVEIANYPFATIDPNVGVVEVPDDRLGKLAVISKSAKVIPASIEFVDIAGLVKGAAQGEGLGNQFLSHIREADAIAQVVRVFMDGDIIHVSPLAGGLPDPVSDIEVLEYELVLKDLETIEKRLQSVVRDARAGKKEAVEEQKVLEQLQAGMQNGARAATVIEDAALISSLQLLTMKPLIYVCNVAEGEVSGWVPEGKLKEKLEGHIWVAVSAKVESELSDLAPEERSEYMTALGITESGLDRLIRAGYETLGLITYLTTGETETRAWTIPKGSTAPRAGRAIHSDFEQKFIRAEIIATEKLLKAGSYPKARELGWLRTEGKEYIVQDGDVVEFKI